MTRALHVALLTHERSVRAEQVIGALIDHGVTPTSLVIERVQVPPFRRRFAERVRRDGIGVLPRMLVQRFQGSGKVAPVSLAIASGPAPLTPAECSKKFGIRRVDITSLRDPSALEVLRAQSIDLMIHAGAGILRKELFDVTRFGVLNGHMGILPEFRGIQVAEWSTILGKSTGYTIHWIDGGIDTGNIVRVGEVDTRNARSIEELRAAVNKEQLAALAETVRSICDTGTPPGGSRQFAQDGCQYFSMHPQVLALLQHRLAARQPSAR